MGEWGVPDSEPLLGEWRCQIGSHGREWGNGGSVPDREPWRGVGEWGVPDSEPLVGGMEVPDTEPWRGIGEWGVPDSEPSVGEWRCQIGSHGGEWGKGGGGGAR